MCLCLWLLVRLVVLGIVKDSIDISGSLLEALDMDDLGKFVVKVDMYGCSTLFA